MECFSGIENDNNITCSVGKQKEICMQKVSSMNCSFSKTVMFVFELWQISFRASFFCTVVENEISTNILHLHCAQFRIYEENSQKQNNKIQTIFDALEKKGQ